MTAELRVAAYFSIWSSWYSANESIVLTIRTTEYCIKMPDILLSIPRVFSGRPEPHSPSAA
ncbi:hypothetical protein IMZ48_37815 [Candidatus Bathyarchaeota archaeon]|nr:hypothetical protein [Candidatus Bathyarchaeota archaeon]